MKVDQHISELLIDHDCVIVPSFGGFLASYQHATIHPTHHTFSPPSKIIAFNIFLTQNDGLLANHLAGQVHVPYNEALREILAFVQHCQKELNEGKKIILERIGSFYFDKEKNLQFEPFKQFNYLQEAYGCGAVQFLPVNRSGSEVHERRHAKTTFQLRDSVRSEKIPIQVVSTSRKKTLSILLVSGMLVWLTLNVYIIAPDRFHVGSFNPFSSKTQHEVVQKKPEPVIKQEATMLPETSETKLEASAVPANQTELVSKNEPAISQPAEPVVQKTVVAKEYQKYFIIGGAFQVPENADAFVKTLQAEGFAGAQILDTPRRLKMVAISGFSVFEDASAELSRVTAIHKSAWIYAR